MEILEAMKAMREGKTTRCPECCTGTLYQIVDGSLIEIVTDTDYWHRSGDIIDSPALGQAWIESDSWEVVL